MSPDRDQLHLQHQRDRQLVKRAVDGDREAKEMILQRLRCVPRILAARNAKLSRPLSQEDLEDLAQETVVRIWRKIETFDGRAALETWVYRFCFLELMNAVRRAARQPRSQDVTELEIPSPVQAEETSDQELIPLLRHLSVREREVIQLRHLEQLGSLTEVAEVLELSVSSVKTHYYRGLEKLRGLAMQRRNS